MRIRTGEADDHTAALEVYRAAQAARGRRPTRERLDRVATKLAEERLVVVEDPDGPGVVGWALSEPGRAKSGRGVPVEAALHLSMLYVAPGRQRQGVGAALLEGLADLAWADGFRTLGVWAEEPDFFVACGFTATGQRQTRGGRVLEQLRAELEPPSREVMVGPDGIRLGQLLKLAGLVDTGSQAKARLAAGEVMVNSEVDTRRGRQLRDGDEIRTADATVVVRTGPGD